MIPRVKICCISSVQEAQVALRHRVSALGLVSAMPSGPGVIDEQTITTISAIVPPGVASFLLTSRQTSAEIITQQRLCRTNTLQLVDSVSIKTYQELRQNLPGIALVQVIHVLGEDSLREAIRVAPHVDALLLDSGNPSLAVKELGGTGRTHSWSLSRKIVEEVQKSSLSKPVYLAGGLNAGNIREAISTVQPFGIDICSSVRTNGHLDEQKLAAFLDIIHH